MNILSEELIRALRAFAQPGTEQLRLFPDRVNVADELVDDWGDAYDRLRDAGIKIPDDLRQIDEFILKHSGIEGYWSTEAVTQKNSFWDELREMAAASLTSRDIAASRPEPSNKTYIFPEPGNR